MDKILDNLYAGSEWDANPSRLKGKIDVTFDLRAEAPCCNGLYSEAGISRHCLPCKDGERVSIGLLDRGVRLIDRELQNGCRVLVHCAAGISRTSTLLCAYLIAYKGMTPDEAIEHVKQCRPCSMPHPELWSSLKEFAERYGHHQVKEWNSVFADEEKRLREGYWVNVLEG